MKFLDQAKIYIFSGKGGHGCVSFRREKFVEYGGPNGGNGGKGGDIVFEATEGLNTLIDFRYRQHFKAKTGENGPGQNRTGRNAPDIVIAVPPGTQVLAEDTQKLLADLTEAGQRARLLKGGDGGLGNSHFKTATNQAPRRSDPGWPGEERWVWLRLKLIADVGLIGLPNAGKSTFLAAVTRARPKIADYPFTTLHPNLGVGQVGEEEFILADIPGLIEGAHEGTGLGDRFLGHIERCGVLLHLLDGTSETLTEDYRTVRHELAAYGQGLAEKAEIIGLNKCDALTEEAIEAKRQELATACGGEVLTLSGVAGSGVQQVLRRLIGFVRAERAGRRKSEEAPAEAAWRP